MDTKELKARRDRTGKALLPLLEKRTLTKAEREEMGALMSVYDEYDRQLMRSNVGSTAIETRTSGSIGPNAVRASSEIEGRPGESLDLRTQSFTEYVRRAAQNGVTTVRREGDAPTRVVWHEQEYLNDYWAVRLGLKAESRALSEDTTGSGLAVVPQAWTSSVVDYLYADSVSGQLGLTVVPLPTELYNKPVFAEPAQPAWLAEGSSIGIDANPAFSTIQFNAMGGFKDITTFSIELAQDAYVSGTLPSMLAQSVARNMALAVDAAAINGVSGNTGNPGLNSEAGFNIRHYTGDSGTSGIAPTDTTEYSVIAEKVRQKNTRVTAFLQNVAVTGTVARLNASTYAKFWTMPADVANVPIVDTQNANVVGTVETDPSTASSVANTGGSYASIYAGNWSYGMLGVHMDLSSRPLVERYADLGQIGLFSAARYSIRWAHPETFYRTIGIVTT